MMTSKPGPSRYLVYLSVEELLNQSEKNIAWTMPNAASSKPSKNLTEAILKPHSGPATDPGPDPCWHSS